MAQLRAAPHRRSAVANQQAENSPWPGRRRDRQPEGVLQARPLSADCGLGLGAADRVRQSCEPAAGTGRGSAPANCDSHCAGRFAHSPGAWHAYGNLLLAVIGGAFGLLIAFVGARAMLL